jgi:hypothetical protein
VSYKSRPVFDCVLMFSGAPADPPADGFITCNAFDAQQVVVGWLPGTARRCSPHPLPA